MTAFDNGLYCDFNSVAAQAVAGKDIILSIWDATGANLYAISGQQGLTINRSAEAIEVSSKDIEGGWKAKIVGMKEWSIDNDGLYVPSSDAHAALSKAFNDGELICLKVTNKKTNEDMFGGVAVLTDYPIEAPYDDAMTYSCTFEGNGALVDLSAEVPSA